MPDIRDRIADEATAAGFDVMRIAGPGAPPGAAGHLADFIERGRHGDMDWMARNPERRGSPRGLWPEVRSIVMLGLNYGPDSDPLAALDRKSAGAISVYARGRDYHDVVKAKLKRVAGWLHRETGAEVKVFVDTAPVMEKPLAEAAGLGWQGKHTNLVSRRFGSWLFLGSIFTTLDLAPDTPHDDNCGSCRSCLDICPTDAFPAPYQLDARRCISYLTIEHRSHIDRALRPAIGNRIFGCDDCLAVCPWNRFAKRGAEARLNAREASDCPPLADLLTLDDAAFRERFRGSPIKRTGRDRFLRNVLIAAGNSGDAALSDAVGRLLGDASPLVRAMAVWASARLMPREVFGTLGRRHASAEPDADVHGEWAAEGLR